MKVRLRALAATGGKTRGRVAIAAAPTLPWATLMTSFALFLGVFPLALAAGAGAEMRQALGILVFFGMIEVSILYVVCRSPVRANVARPAGRAKSVGVSEEG